MHDIRARNCWSICVGSFEAAVRTDDIVGLDWDGGWSRGDTEACGQRAAVDQKRWTELVPFDSLAARLCPRYAYQHDQSLAPRLLMP